VIKPKPLQAPVEGGFTVDDFAVDEQAGTVTCPAGNTVALSRTRIATFGVACRDCPLGEQCTTCKTGRKLVLHPRDGLLRQARADWAAGTGLREDYMAHRPNVERAVVQVATSWGRRLRLCYRGVTKNHAWLKRRTAAQPILGATSEEMQSLRPSPLGLSQ
jgi:Transposase DDE domain